MGDRANALQNELARSQKQRTVKHANGDVSVLPPASDFCRSSALNEPLLEQGEAKLDEYRAAYRSWRTGSHQGLRRRLENDMDTTALWQKGRHRTLLPLQLMPPRPYRVDYDEEGLEGALMPGYASSLATPTSPSPSSTPGGGRKTRSALTSAGGSYRGSSNVVPRPPSPRRPVGLHWLATLVHAAPQQCGGRKSLQHA